MKKKMMRIGPAGLLFFALNLSPAWAIPQAEFQQAYRLIKDADRAAWEGEVDPALESYRRALSLLDDLSWRQPDWNPAGVKKSSDHCAARLWNRLPDAIGGRGEVAGRKLAVSFIDVGQGDSILIECPAGERILIDGGTREAGGQVVDYLRRRGVRQIDLMIATHPHSDHIGGLPEVIKRFGVKKFIDPGLEHTSRDYEDLLHLVRSRRIPYELGRRGNEYRFGEVAMRIFSPGEQLFESPNNCSVVTEFRYGDIGFLLTGDAEQEAERGILGTQLLSRCQILKAGHHGSNTSSGPDLLLPIKPEVAIVSCGRGNPFGHPARVVLERFQASACDYYRTDEGGNIRVETDGRQYQVILERRPPDPRAQAERPRRESEKLDINGATVKQLEALPRIGPVKARAIVDYRIRNGPFEKIEDIVNVSGIGPKTLNFLQDHIRVSLRRPPAPEKAPGSGEQAMAESRMPGPAVPTREPLAESGPVDINTATARQLQELPGIGPVKAQAIVDYRDKQGPFEKIDDIVKVSGIGPKTLESLRDKILAGTSNPEQQTADNTRDP